MISVVIRTIGRNTLGNAIDSAMSEFDKVIVVADDTCLDLSLPKGPTYLKTGKRYDKYGSKAMLMGALACTTEYFCLLDDDDEFVKGAGAYMTDAVSKSDFDILIPSIRFNNGMVLCDNPSKGVSYGNVAVPTYRTSVFVRTPISEVYLKCSNQGIPEDAIDFAHINFLKGMGLHIGWYNKILYNIRPKLEGTNGRGV
tara:strand:- start:1869 stop:2462 length:594 start_codon:yes stop_codon:yes gene_type:complete